MAKKSTKKSARGASKKTGGRKGAGGRKGSRKTAMSNLQRLRDADAIDPDRARDLDDAAKAAIESLTASEVKALITAHRKVSPAKRWEPDSDGSIF